MSQPLPLLTQPPSTLIPPIDSSVAIAARLCVLAAWYLRKSRFSKALGHLKFASEILAENPQQNLAVKNRLELVRLNTAVVYRKMKKFTESLKFISISILNLDNFLKFENFDNFTVSLAAFSRICLAKTLKKSKNFHNAEKEKNLMKNALEISQQNFGISHEFSKFCEKELKKFSEEGEGATVGPSPATAATAATSNFKISSIDFLDSEETALPEGPSRLPFSYSKHAKVVKSHVTLDLAVEKNPFLAFLNNKEFQKAARFKMLENENYLKFQVENLKFKSLKLRKLLKDFDEKFLYEKKIFYTRAGFEILKKKFKNWVDVKKIMRNLKKDDDPAVGKDLHV